MLGTVALETVAARYSWLSDDPAVWERECDMRTNRHNYRVYRSGDRMGGETQGKPLGRHKPAGREAVPCVT